MALLARPRTSVCLVVAVAVLTGCRDGQRAEPSHTPVVLRAVAYGDRDGVWLDPAGDGPPRRLADGRDPALSPDGRFLAYRDPYGRGDGLHVVSTRDPERDLVRAGPADFTAWARDAPVFAAAVSGGIRIWNLETGRSVRVAGAPQAVGRISLSPDASEIAFLATEELLPGSEAWRSDVWTASLDGSTRPKARRLTDEGDVGGPFFTSHGLVVTRRGALWLLDDDGSFGRQLATLRKTFPNRAAHPDAAAADIADDDRSLLVDAYCVHGCSRVHVVDIETGKTTLFEYGAPVGISRDGTRVLVQEDCDSGLSGLETFALVAIDVPGGHRQTVASPDTCGASWTG